ncbi:MAG: LAGLIDADG family homing endonuclease, partial [Nanoarchaeota archaeon]|nr:LAGLIDADG family homing endonuclease [Nanoarchaeota archaeon]
DTIEFSLELATLIALLYTDGGVSKHGVRSWRIYFTNSSQVAIKLFVDSVVAVFNIAPDRIQVKQRYATHYLARVTSKEIGDYLINTFGTFRTLKFENGSHPPAKLPLNKIIESNFIADFLRVVFSMDGGVKFYSAKEVNGRSSLRKNICLACHHPKLREQYYSLLKKLGIKATNVLSDNVIRIQGEKDVKMFAKKVGFIEGIEVTNHSRYWVGKKKNDVMKFMLESYDNPSYFLKLLNANR